MVKKLTRGTYYLAASLLAGALYASIAVIAVGKEMPHTVDYAPALEDMALMPGDTPKLAYPPQQNPLDPHNDRNKPPIDLKTPDAIDRQVELDDSLENFRVNTSVGGEEVGETSIEFDEYMQARNREFLKDYFKERSLGQVMSQGTEGNQVKDRINQLLPINLPAAVDIRPQGSAQLIFSLDFNRVANPTWSLREQRNTQFKFDQKIQASVIGSIGDKIQVGINYDTEASFAFDNQRKINYIGKEDEIVRAFEVGDISMPIGNNSLITGSSRLFGIKTQLQFGKLGVAAVVSQQESERKVVTLENGAQKQQFNIQGDDYEMNRHFFLAHYFRDNFNRWNEMYPAVPPVIITRVEVWVTNRQAAVQDSRNIVAFMDLGERDTPRRHNTSFIQPGTVTGPFADNNSNTLYQTLTTGPNTQRYRDNARVSEALADAPNFEPGRDYMKVDNARQLRQTEFTFHPYFGYISVNTPLNPDDVLAVAYEYTVNGVRYQVGELSRTDVPPDPNNPNVLFLKMLKSVILNPRLPIWDLMMKNIYSLDAYQVSPTDFRLQVIYANDNGADLNYIPEPNEPMLNGQPLIRLLNLDRFNSLMERKYDGNFDFIENVTIQANNGRIIFPVVEPFGSDLRKLFQDQRAADKYVFQSLYDSTKFAAQQQARLNKFFIRGSYQGAAGNVISLNSLNVQQGSVRVSAGGVPLQEGVDYTVDYNMGRVTILNTAVLNSGQVINVESESNNLMTMQQKTFLGTRLDYRFTKDFNVGGTFLYLRERPLTPKINSGDEPLRNAIGGFDLSYRTDSRLLTTLVDKIPLIETKAKSQLLLQGEFARIFPSQPKLIQDPASADKEGVAYIDDFEGSEVPIDLRLGQHWYLAATPPSTFAEGRERGERANYNRAFLSWYIIDPIFFNETNLTPGHIRRDRNMLSNHYMRQVTEVEVFRNKQVANNTIPILPTFDITYFPSERGPYNYNASELTPDGRLTDPRKRWAGITRAINVNDFEAANIEYLEFWLMDPYLYDPNHTGGDLYINLGNVSEDVLRDNRKSYENGLPKDPNETREYDETEVARVPNGIQINNAFDNDPAARPFQDVGLDGLRDEDERAKFRHFVDAVPASARDRIAADPSHDNFVYFTDPIWDQQEANILQRYKYWNGTEGNTPVSVTPGKGFGSQFPDDEDINRDFTLNEVEEYFEYRVSLRRQDLEIGKNYVVDMHTVPKRLPNDKTEDVTWYLFKVPVRQFTGKHGDIQDYKSIRFMRMYFTGFEDSVTCRFAQLQLIRSDWRKYLLPLEVGESVPPDKQTIFDVTTVNVEENGTRSPIPYQLPPGIIRERDFTTPFLVPQNEQSLAFNVCNLMAGDGRAAFKTLLYDLRQYKRLKMFVHAEAVGTDVQDDDVEVFIRMGADQDLNYYEYSYPLKLTPGPTTDQLSVWPEANNMDLPLEALYNAKEAKLVGNLPRITVTGPKGNDKITVVGNPDVGNVRVIMIGVRNTRNHPIEPCVEIWVNELRAVGFDNRGGWAANARATAQLADFGRVELSGSRRTIGFGGLEQSLLERSQQDMRSYGIMSSFELGKFFPARFNVRIPMFYSYSQQVNTPRFNPMSPDLPLQSLINAYAEQPGKQDSVRRATQDFTAIKSLNFTGVQKMRGPNQTKQHIYDIENFTATYIWSETFRRNTETLYQIERNNQGQLGYNYAFNPKAKTPFKNVAGGKIKLINDFNYYLLPQTWAASIEAQRRYGEKQYRPTDNVETIAEIFYDKAFTVARNYDLRYNLSRGLRFTYTGRAVSRIEEPFGPVDTEEKRQELNREIMRLGKLNSYNHTVNGTWDLPINKIKMLNWITMQTSYTGNYDWITAPPANDSLGNTIQNSQVVSFTNQLNMSNLYNQVPFLKTLNQQRTRTQARGAPPMPGMPTPNQPRQQQDQKDQKDTIPRGQKIAQNLATMLLMVRTVNLSYSINNGTLLPGFTPTGQYAGYDGRTGGPGVGFLLGSQEDIRERALREGWMTTDTNQNQMFRSTKVTTINGTALIEPVRNFRINVDMNQRKGFNFQENFRAIDDQGTFAHLSPMESGNFTTSFLPIKTSFNRPDRNNRSQLFKNLEANRIQVSQRLAEQNPVTRQMGLDDSTGYYSGYGPYHQEVLIPAFLGAYTGKDGSNVRMNPFTMLPAPNWRVNWTGLGNIEFIKRYAQAVTVSHGYRSVFNLTNFITNLEYDPDRVPGLGENLPSEYQIDQVSIQESFAPLIGIDFTLTNNWTGNVRYNTTRNMSLSFSDRRLTETNGTEIVIGAGFRKQNFRVPFRINRKFYTLPNDLIFRLDFSIRDQRTSIRVLDQEEGSRANQDLGGQRMIVSRPTLQYNISRSLISELFVAINMTRPYTSMTYPTSFTSVGFSLRYTFTGL